MTSCVFLFLFILSSPFTQTNIYFNVKINENSFVIAVEMKSENGNDIMGGLVLSSFACENILSIIWSSVIGYAMNSHILLFVVTPLEKCYTLCLRCFAAMVVTFYFLSDQKDDAIYPTTKVIAWVDQGTYTPTSVYTLE